MVSTALLYSNWNKIWLWVLSGVEFCHADLRAHWKQSLRMSWKVATNKTLVGRFYRFCRQSRVGSWEEKAKQIRLLSVGLSEKHKHDPTASQKDGKTFSDHFFLSEPCLISPHEATKFISTTTLFSIQMCAHIISPFGGVITWIQHVRASVAYAAIQKYEPETFWRYRTSAAFFLLFFPFRFVHSFFNVFVCRWRVEGWKSFCSRINDTFLTFPWSDKNMIFSAQEKVCILGKSTWRDAWPRDPRLLSTRGGDFSLFENFYERYPTLVWLAKFLILLPTDKISLLSHLASEVWWLMHLIFKGPKIWDGGKSFERCKLGKSCMIILASLWSSLVSKPLYALINFNQNFCTSVQGGKSPVTIGKANIHIVRLRKPKLFPVTAFITFGCSKQEDNFELNLV